MRPRGHGLVLDSVLAAALACAGTAGARASDAASAGRVDCGGAHLAARTVLREVPDHDRQTLSQTITIVPPGATTASPLKLDVRPLRQPFLRDTSVLDAAVTGWACVTSTDHRSYVLLSLTCTESPLRPGCAGPTREWTRLYDLRGRALDAGYPRDAGPREQALAKRLKLDLDSVPLSDPLE